jgi:RND family efflux transporter MFP subunit
MPVADPQPKPDLSSLRIHRDDIPERDSGHRGRRARAWLWIPSIGVLIVLVILFALQATDQTSAVETAVVQRLSPAAAQSLLTATGYVVAQRKASVASKGTGRLEVLNVEEGDKVQTGDILGQLEADDVNAALRAARAAVGQAEAEVTRAQALATESELTYNRVSELLSRKLVSQAEFDNAEAAYNSAQAIVGAAEAGLRVARADADYATVQVDNTFIRAPFDGTVLTKDADVGEIVAPFASSASSKGAIVTLADMNSLEVEADVSESNIQNITPGQRCVIVLDAFPADPYTGYVKKIVPTADRAKATVMVKVAFDDLDSRVLPEMSAKASFLPADADTSALNASSILAVPVAALSESNNTSIVFVVRQGQVYQTSVQIGRSYGGSIEIKSGLNAGEVVVVRPPANMHDGDAVELAQ